MVLEQIVMRTFLVKNVWSDICAIRNWVWIEIELILIEI